ncbi:ATP-binding protein [Pseudobacteroides cellulosolvens]|uniref:Cobyrinic acid ac-diamide synthase n=1 Tax=Pseudobacteroides cellulosolvens ATCC 35603 = DSM 2933 TaxID=398512 RepID=A0A0L6JVL2_9FIRM|nr:ATP-binding protein [Pseudobacteroides cellulosolvens]KNY29472.1 Cobyrinic acid ac-diamide synthase [Pseudobacteroides cellulosolvens ATCC 35603 = DSM 2933]
MKQIAFVSGKGGTGKSTLVSSLSILVKDKMLADCDVDAPNLHILLNGDIVKQEDYFGAKEAVINSSVCIKCGLCKRTCRFDAISEKLEVLPVKCEGCGACTLVCPVGAICLEEVKTGQTYVAKTDRGTFSHALLDIGAEGSGKLVTEVRKNIYNYKNNEKWVLIDGSPGIGCVVIASITGADAVVAVSEPTLSGLSDLKRVLSVVQHFQIPAFVCINKYDLNPEITAQIEEYCIGNGFPVIGKIPFDPTIVKALQQFQTPVEAGNEIVTEEIKNIWEQLMCNGL